MPTNVQLGRAVRRLSHARRLSIEGLALTSSGQLYAFGENRPTTTPTPDSAEPDGLKPPTAGKNDRTSQSSSR